MGNFTTADETETVTAHEVINSITLDINLVGELMKNNNFEDSDKLQLLILFDSEEMNEDIAKSIRNMEVNVKKEYVESAWNLLNESDRYQLLLNQLEIYNAKEISEKFKLLAPAYKALSETSRKHKEYLDVTDYNTNLLKKLQQKNYITSFEEETYEREDFITHRKQQLKRFGVWIKQRQ